MGTRNWYRVDTANGTYYTPFTTYKLEHYTVGDGLETPTPEDIAKEFNKGNRSVVYDHRTKTFSRTVKGVMDEPIELPAGSYEYENVNSGRLREVPIRSDAAAEIGGPVGDVINSIRRFLEAEQIYRENGIIYKLGVLMYGKPGCGKSMTIRQVLNNIATDDAIVIFLNNLPTGSFLTKIQKTLGDRLKIFIFEELTEAFDPKRQGLDQVLNFLDGEYSIDKSICLATTNYPEALPHNIVDRPSRFDKVIHVTPPNAEDRAKIIRHFLKTDPTPEQIRSTDGMTIAVLKEICLSVLVEGVPFDTALNNMKTRSRICKEQFKESRGKGDVGFGI